MTGSDVLQYFGRFHPVLVHFPIGALVILALLETLALAPRFRPAKAASGYILAFAVLTALLSATCGWFLAGKDGYDPQLLALHRWTGLAVAALTATTALLYRCKHLTLYRPALYATALTLIIGSHYGGSLTHGKDYLAFRHTTPRAQGAQTSLDAAPDGVTSRAGMVLDKKIFAEIIQPIFRERCAACHNADKHKGGLLLVSYQDLLKGGDNGPVVKPGNASASPLLHRLLLPPDHDDHMPPDGKPQPTPDQIELLRWWIQAGAPEEKTLQDLNPPPAILKIVSAGSTADARWTLPRLEPETIASRLTN